MPGRPVRIRRPAERHVSLPLRELPPVDLVAGHDVAQRAESGLSLHQGRARAPCLEPRRPTRILRGLRISLIYENAKDPDAVDLYAASLSDASVVTPTRHVFTREQLPWFEVHDTLPRYATTMRSGDPPIRNGVRHGVKHGPAE